MVGVLKQFLVMDKNIFKNIVNVLQYSLLKLALQSQFADLCLSICTELYK